MSIKLNSFVVADPMKCIGCRVCEVACSTAHTEPAALTAGALQNPIIPKLYLVHTAEVTMPVQCHHCEDAPCANSCPIGAIRQDGDQILVSEDNCVGCKSCLMACPFGAIDFAPKYVGGEEVAQLMLKSETNRGVKDKAAIFANKCDLCAGQPDGPACVQNCPEKALEIIEPTSFKKNRNQAAALNTLQSVRNLFN